MFGANDHAMFGHLRQPWRWLCATTRTHIFRRLIWIHSGTGSIKLKEFGEYDLTLQALVAHCHTVRMSAKNLGSHSGIFNQKVKAHNVLSLWYRERDDLKFFSLPELVSNPCYYGCRRCCVPRTCRRPLCHHVERVKWKKGEKKKSVKFA